MPKNPEQKTLAPEWMKPATREHVQNSIFSALTNCRACTMTVGEAFVIIMGAVAIAEKEAYQQGVDDIISLDKE